MCYNKHITDRHQEEVESQVACVFKQNQKKSNLSESDICVTLSRSGGSDHFWLLGKCKQGIVSCCSKWKNRTELLTRGELWSSVSAGGTAGL